MRSLSDEHYARELRYVVRATEEFVQDRAKFADRLKPGSQGQDPHVRHLVSAFALMSGRIRQKIDDGFPEIAATLLDLLYPHYLRPVPSMGVAKLEPQRAQARRAKIAAGKKLTTESILGEPCEYRTSWDVDLQPIEVKAARFENVPGTAMSEHRRSAKVATLDLDLELVGGADSFATIGFDGLTLHIADAIEPDGHAYELYRAMTQHVTEVVFEDPTGEAPPLALDNIRFEPMGLDADDVLLDDGPRSDRAYALLTEYFTCPRRFLFLRLAGWSIGDLERFKSGIRVRAYLSKRYFDLESAVRASSFALGCTPVVNLFPMTSPGASITLDHTRSSYDVIPDTRRDDAVEVYSIDRVSALKGDDSIFDYRPFYAVRFAREPEMHRRFYSHERRDSGRDEGGTDVSLSFVDFDLDQDAPAEGTVHVETTCMNRQLHSVLPNHLSPAEQIAVQSVSFVGGCTPPIPPVAGRERLWRLLSHLSTNHVPLTSDDGSPAALQQLLELYNVRGSEEARFLIGAIHSVTSRRGTGVVPSGGELGGVRRGLEITVDVEAEDGDDWLFLFGSVLDRFFGMYSAINMYTRLTVRIPEAGRADKTTKRRYKEFHRWPARSGRRALM